jgi:hypothetical protein
VVGDLGERIKAVDRREHLAAFLRQQRLGRATDGLAVIDDEYFQTLELGVAAGHGQTTSS